MIQVSPDYLNAANASARNSYYTIVLSNNNYVEKGNVRFNVNIDLQDFCNTELLETEHEEREYITCEHNRVTCDGTFYFVNNKNSVSIDQPIALQTKLLRGYSDANGKIADVYSIFIISLNNTDFKDKGIKIILKEPLKSFKLKYRTDTLQQTEPVYEYEVTNNTSNVIVIPIQPIDEKVLSIEICNIYTLLPYRCLKISSIVLGDLISFQKEQIDNIDVIEETNLDASELLYNSCEVIILDKKREYDVLTSNVNAKKLQNYKYVAVYHNLKVASRYDAIPLGTYQIETVKYSKNEIEISAYSKLYFCSDVQFTHSQFYVAKNGAENLTVINDILKDLFSYVGIKDYEVIDIGLGNYSITRVGEPMVQAPPFSEGIQGFFKPQTIGECLRQLLEVTCGFIKENSYGKIQVFVNSIAPFHSANNKLYSNKYNYANRTVHSEEYETLQKYSTINVKVHNYSLPTTDTEQEVELYNGNVTISSNSQLEIEFQKMPAKVETIYIESDNSGSIKIQEKYACTCVLENSSDKDIVNSKIVIKGYVFPNIISKKQFTYDYINGTELEIDNTFVRSNTFAQNVARFKNCLVFEEPQPLSTKNRIVKWSLETHALPYLEVGDMIEYKYSLNNQNYYFIISKREFTNSIIEQVEGN